MITITLPEWFLYLVAVVVLLKGTEIMSDTVMKYLDHRFKKKLDIENQKRTAQ